MTTSTLSEALESMALEELSAHIVKAQAILVRKQEEVRSTFIEETRKKAEALGLSLKDLFPDTSGKPTQPRQKGERTGERRKVPMKYRDPENAENAWSGRGMMPTWLRTKIENGGKVEDYLIEPATLI